MTHYNYIKNEFDANDMIDMITDYVNIDCNENVMNAMKLPFNHKMHLKNLSKKFSGYYRLLEIEALLRAFQLDIKTTIENASWKPDEITEWTKMAEIEFFLKGNFLWNKQHLSKKWNERLISLHKSAKDKIKNKEQFYQNSCFQNLFLFHRQLTMLVGKQGAPLEGIGLNNLFFHSIVREALKNRSYITDTLLEVIDSDKKTFNKSELIEKYGYPKENLHKIYKDAYNKMVDNY